MTERIIIEIDDSQLDAALTKLNIIGVEGKRITGTTNLKTGLPGINREMRLILGRIPGMRQAIQAYFRIKRIESGLEFGSLEALTASATSFQGMLTIIATTLIIVQWLVNQEKERKKADAQLRTFIMRERGLNKAGYKQVLFDWQKTLGGLPP